MKPLFRNILIVRTDRMGDVVLTTPVIAMLRRNLPDARISMLVSPSTRELVEHHPGLNEVLVDDRRGRHKGLVGFWRLVGDLKRKKFDAALVLHTKRRTNTLCFFSGIPVRIGYKDNKFGFLLTHPVKDTRHLGLKHESQYCLDIVRRSGIQDENSYQTEVVISSDHQRWALDYLHQEGVRGDEHLIAIHAGGSDATKRWSKEHFVELIEKLRQTYPGKILLVGASDIRPINEHIMKHIPQGVIDSTGRTSEGQMAALLKRCRILVSNDSGPVHVAAAVGTPVVVLFFRNHPGVNAERWHPLGAHHKVLKSHQNYNLELLRQGKIDTQCLETISVQEVFQAVDAVLRLC